MRYSISTTDAESSAEQKEAVPREAWIGQMRKGVSAGSDPHNFWDSEKQLRFETLLVEISTRFVNLPADQIDGEITNAQRRICELLDFDRSALWQVSTKEQGTGLLTHMHQPSGGPTAPERPDMRDLFPWGSQKVMSGEILAISKMADLPPEAARDLESFRQYGTKSTLVFPLSTGGGKVLGLLTFAMMQEERSWPEMAVKRFQLVAQVFANALARKHADDALRESEERLSLATDSADLGLWIMELDTSRVWVTAKTRELYGFLPEEELTYESFLKVICPEDREQVEQAVQQAMLSGEPLRSEFRVLLPDGSISWIGTRGKRYSKSNGNAERLMGVSLDITERKQAEEALRQSYAEIERLKDRLQAESDYLKAEIKVTQAHSEIIGQSAGIKKVLRQVEQVAPTDSSVLIHGETGTGKELIAQAIHRLSPRRSKVMVKVNCAALPSALVESELFGREKGAFTGALTRQIGRFEVADGSTIFLDEIGELSLEVQAKLLRVLQEGQFERLGSPRTIKVNVRVIAATNRDLAEEIRKGRFREDLLLPPQRVSDLGATAAGAGGGHPATGLGLPQGVLLPHGQEDQSGAAEDDGSAPAPSLAGQRARVAERHRARRHRHHRRDAEGADAGGHRRHAAGRRRPWLTPSGSTS